jgi:coenzyme Q-binding protein COQ10
MVSSSPLTRSSHHAGEDFERLSLVRGPFRKLFAEWRITESVAGASDVSLEIHYEFKNPFIGFLAAANHDLATDRILNAFLLEARSRFGPRSAP